VLGLNNLAYGASYAKVGLTMREHRRRAIQHLAEVHGLTDVLNRPTASKKKTWSTAEGKSAWHLGANLVEQYSPVVYSVIEKEMLAYDQSLREQNDELLAADPSAKLNEPLVYIIDEVPVILRRRRREADRYQAESWSLLVAVQMRWRTQPEDTQPSAQTRLRLVRAYPGSNVAAFRLLFEELQVRPDFIVSDTATNIQTAAIAQWGAGAVGHIPSLFHMSRNLREAIIKHVPDVASVVGGHKTVTGVLGKHVAALNRDDMLNMGPADWSGWWDQLLSLIAEAGGPVGPFREQRRAYESRFAAALPIVRQHTHLPMSNAAVETQIRLSLQPLLENRKQMYRNLARTNFLCDLVVCQSQGLFTDLDRVARIIRADNEANGGWAPAPRQVTDTQPRVGSLPGEEPTKYSSLLNPLIVQALFDKRIGVTGDDEENEDEDGEE
jgi:hypothetical protein